MNHSQNLKEVNNDADLEAAINNKNYTATIVNYMTTTCSRSIYMKVISFFYSLDLKLYHLCQSYSSKN
jgi:hypothetical protein